MNMTEAIEKTIGSGLQEYEGKIWSTADTLYSNGFKASDWPNLMMPFFALMLVESRIIRVKNEKIKELELEMEVSFDYLNDEHIELLDESLKYEKYGYHEELIKHGRTLKSICETQPSNFYSRLMEYLSLYDIDTKKLLGVEYAEGTSKHLDLKGSIGALNSKSQADIDVLYTFTKKWADIDLSIFNNSEVTTIEEHIKHKWADISAETAGEHYTPLDVIELCTDINAAIAPIDPNGSWSIYDMTCGGGNFVFGLEDSLRQKYPKLSVHSYGQEYNDQLYALAAIEARFRPSANIKYGNTLTNDRLSGELFGSVIGNPPYGTDWKEFSKAIKADKSGRFNETRMPPVSDSQMLFLQHAVSHMKENGVGSIVHNGSPLTSGDAGGAESNIRKYLLKDLDVVQAIIQLPQGIFFNTGISTYVWVLNKSKPAHLKGKVILVNAENMYEKLKKSLNKKTCKVGFKNREEIITLLTKAVDTEVCKVLDVDQLMYNKVDIEITRQDENGLSASTQKLDNVFQIVFGGNTQTKLTIENGIITKQEIIGSDYSLELSEIELKKSIAESELTVVLTDNENCNVFTHVTDNNQITYNKTSLGAGLIDIKIKKNKAGQLTVNVFISPAKEKDSEITSYSSDKPENQKLIEDFLSQWVKEPHKILEAKEGCEINFNKVFPKKIEIRNSKDILKEIALLDKELGEV